MPIHVRRGKASADEGSSLDRSRTTGTAGARRQPLALVCEDLGRLPDLGLGFELVEKVPGRNPALGRVHLVSYGAPMSHADVASDMPGVNMAGERVAGAIVAALFQEDLAAMRRKIEAFDEPELQGTPFYVPPAERGHS
jgi:hypothetical protein